MFQEYYELYKKYTQKYGQKTAIFLMVGSFYELYEIQNKETGKCRCNVKDIVDFLGCQVSIKKDIDAGYDGLVAGFPDYAMNKWAGKLTSIGWTVVIVDQIKDNRGKVTERKVSRILSPSTHIENITSADVPYVVSLYFEPNQGTPPQFAAAALDLTTGMTISYTGAASGRPDIWTADDLVQMLSVYQPKELIIYWRSQIQIPPDESFFRRIFGISQTVPLHIRPVETLGSFSKELVRSEYFQKIYSIKSVLPAKTYLGLRSENEETVLILLLQFIEEHYPSMLKSFQRNEPWIPQARLICGNHALTQLQMTGNNLNETVVGLFDKCITPMGKRAIRDRLLIPYSDPAEISAQLDKINDYMAWSQEKTSILEKQLRFMFDLPRLHRKLLCGIITFQEIAGLFQTYSSMYAIMTKVTYDTLLKEPFTLEQWLNYLNVFNAHFTEEKAQAASNDLTAFNVNKYKDIAETENEIQDILAGLQNLRKEIEAAGEVNEDVIRLEEREKEPYGLKASTVTLQQLKRNIKHLPEGTKFSELKSGGWIDCTKLQQLNTRLQKSREKLSTLVKIHIAEACSQIADAGQGIWMDMENWVSHIDCTQCIGRISREYGFCCPKIESVDDSGSGFDIKYIRHPLVEASSTRVSYVKHNVSLGYNNTKGWLVYGMNASGKSTLMKATGICILLAQAGCFVPAKEMLLKPFKAVYTRILNQDNLFAGLSSFAVEMSELRDILRNANKYTLVLGDELCAGTESISAQALVSSGIQWLSNKNAKFIFATHLHDIPTIIDSCKLGVEVWHLHVEYDPVTKKLIYDRSLRQGSGSTLYGLEVARAMDLPFEFIEKALENRHKIMGSVTQMHAKPSIWNPNIVRKECEVCKKQITSELEVHHIQPRETANNGILPDGMHMNNNANLIVLCQKCHDDIHAKKIEIGEIKMTSDGSERTIIRSNELTTYTNENEKLEKPPPHKKGKWSEEEHQIIMDTLKKYSTLSLKSIRAHLSSKHEIEISEAILSKIRKGII